MASRTKRQERQSMEQALEQLQKLGNGLAEGEGKLQAQAEEEEKADAEEQVEEKVQLNLPSPVLTTGIYGWRPQEFLRMLSIKHVKQVIDTRFTPNSRSPAWSWISKEPLSLLLSTQGISYIHLQSLAPSGEAVLQQREEQSRQPRRFGQDRFNVPLPQWYLQDYTMQAQHSLDLLLSQVAQAQPGVTLILGVQAQPQHCHRQVLSSLLQAEGLKVEEVLGTVQVQETVQQRLHRMERLLARERESTLSLLHQTLEVVMLAKEKGVVELDDLPLVRMSVARSYLEAEMQGSQA